MSFGCMTFKEARRSLARLLYMGEGRLQCAALRSIRYMHRDITMCYRSVVACTLCVIRLQYLATLFRVRVLYKCHKATVSAAI